MKMTKTTANKTITLTLVFYGVLFILMPILLNKDMWGSPIFKLLLFITSPLFLFGLWKYEYYKYNKTQINKYNFLGLVIRKYPLNEMKSYKNKVSRNKSTHNPFVFLSYFNKKLRKFIVFNTIQVIFNDNKIKN